MGRILATLLLALFVASGCVSPRPIERVSLQDVTPPDAIPAQTIPERAPIRVAAASIISPQETVRTYGAFFQYLERKVGRPVEVVQRKTYEETYDLLRLGSLEVAMVCTYVYALAHEEIGLEVLGAPEVGGKAQYQSYVIVKSDSGLAQFSDLKDRRFAYTDPLSTSGYVYPLARIKALGKEPGSFFSFITYTYSHDNSIQAVSEGLVDGAAVDSLVYDHWVRLNPELGAKLRIIERSEPLPSPPVAVTKTLDPKLRESIRQAILHMHEDEEGRKILDSLGVDRYVPQDDSQYDIVHDLARQAGMMP